MQRSSLARLRASRPPPALLSPPCPSITSLFKQTYLFTLSTNFYSTMFFLVPDLSQRFKYQRYKSLVPGRFVSGTKISIVMELWSSLLNHHLHERDHTSFADPAGCSSYGARHATCKDKAPRRGAHKQPRPETKFSWAVTCET